MAVFTGASYVLTGAGEPARLQGAMASANLFDLLGVQPALGRRFLPSEDAPHANEGADSIILTDRVWREHFGASPGIIGQVVALDGMPFRIVGVMAAGFDWRIDGSNPDFWVTMAPLAVPGPNSPRPLTEERTISLFAAVGRMKPNVTITQARADMDRVAHLLMRAYPAEDSSEGVIIAGLHETITGDRRPALLILLAAAGLVLLIACADISGLVLARVARRRREIVVRAAIGAARWDIARQLLIESLVVSGLGSAAGIWIAAIGAPALARFGDLPPGAAGLDARVVLFTLVITVLGALVFSLAPVLHASRIDLMYGLREASIAIGEGRRDRNVQSTMIAGQLALATVLLSTTAVLLSNLVRLERQDPGFRPGPVLAFPVTLPQARYPQASRSVFFEDLLSRMRAIPGVEIAGVAAQMPLRTGIARTVLSNVAGREIPVKRRRGIAFSPVAGDYFQALSIPLKRGRLFSTEDRVGSQPVVILNESAARRYFPGSNPVGQLVTPEMWNGSGSTTRPRLVVGVVGDVKMDGLSAAPFDTIYWPLAQIPSESRFFVALRTTVPPAKLAKAAAARLHEADRDLPAWGMLPLADSFENSLSGVRGQALLLTLFTVLAVLLAAIGLYGVIAWTVAQRTREIGLRMALGAGRSTVLWEFTRRALRLTIAGVAVGVLGSSAAMRLVRPLVIGPMPDPSAAIAAAAALLLAISIAASWIPARRASRVDPLDALRYD
jgi:predicted permease